MTTTTQQTVERIPEHPKMTLSGRQREHEKFINSAMACGVPQLQFVSVSNADDWPADAYPEDYRPLVTLLHRCVPSVKCCPKPKEQHKPVKTEQVEIVFHNNAERRLEVLTFTNHTSCGCVAKDKPRRWTVLFRSWNAANLLWFAVKRTSLLACPKHYKSLIKFKLFLNYYSKLLSTLRDFLLKL